MTILRHIALAIALVFAIPSGNATTAHAGVLKKVGKKIKKTKRKVKKTSKRKIRRSRRQLARAGKSVNKVTGAIDGVIDRAYALTNDELEAAAKYAERQADKAADRLAKLGEKAIMAAYRRAYKKTVKPYASLLADIAKRQDKFDDLIIEIGLHLTVGNFEKAAAKLRALKRHPDMQPILERAHKVMGTSLVVMGYVSGGAYFGSAGGTFGAAINLSEGKPQIVIFVAAGGAITTEVKPNVGIGISVGFLKGDPTNISGWAIDAAASVGLTKVVSAAVGLSFTPPDAKPPYVHPVPILTTYSLGAGAGGTDDSPGSVSLGASHTFILQRIK